MTIITVRGRTIAVNAKSGTQVARYIAQYSKLSNATLDSHAAEYRARQARGAVS